VASGSLYTSVADLSNGVATPGCLSLDVFVVVCSVGTSVRSLTSLLLFLLHNPWKEAVANTLPSASFPTRGTDLGEHSVLLGLDILHCLMFLEEGLSFLHVTAFVLGWACWRNQCCLRCGYTQALCH